MTLGDALMNVFAEAAWLSKNTGIRLASLIPSPDSILVGAVSIGLFFFVITVVLDFYEDLLWFVTRCEYWVFKAAF